MNHDRTRSADKHSTPFDGEPVKGRSFSQKEIKERKEQFLRIFGTQKLNHEQDR